MAARSTYGAAAAPVTPAAIVAVAALRVWKTDQARRSPAPGAASMAPALRGCQARHWPRAIAPRPHRCTRDPGNRIKAARRAFVRGGRRRADIETACAPDLRRKCRTGATSRRAVGIGARSIGLGEDPLQRHAIDAQDGRGVRMVAAALRHARNRIYNLERAARGRKAHITERHFARHPAHLGAHHIGAVWLHCAPRNARSRLPARFNRPLRAWRVWRISRALNNVTQLPFGAMIG